MEGLLLAETRRKGFLAKKEELKALLQKFFGIKVFPSLFLQQISKSNDFTYERAMV